MTPPADRGRGPVAARAVSRLAALLGASAAALLPSPSARAESFDVPAIAASSGPFITAYGVVRIKELYDEAYRISLNHLPPGATSHGIFTDTDIMAYIISGAAEIRPPLDSRTAAVAEAQTRGRTFAAGRYVLMPRGTFKPRLLAEGAPMLATAVRFPSPTVLGRKPGESPPAGAPRRPPYVDPGARVSTLALDALPGAEKPVPPGTLRWLPLPGTKAMGARRLDLGRALGPRRVPGAELVYIVHDGRVEGSVGGERFSLGRGGVIRVPAGAELSLAPAGAGVPALVEVSMPPRALGPAD